MGSTLSVRPIAGHITGATLHKYIETSTARDLNGTFLDKTTERFGLFKSQVLSGWADSGSKEKAPRLWGGEIGPHNGGAPGCDHTSMRWATYADSLWCVVERTIWLADLTQVVVYSQSLPFYTMRTRRYHHADTL